MIGRWLRRRKALRDERAYHQWLDGVLRRAGTQMDWQDAQQRRRDDPVEYIDVSGSS
jgi:hypothetical protein